MSLLTFEDVQAERNIDFTEPNGQMVATSLIAAATAWVEKYVGYPIEQAEQTDYFSDGHQHFWIRTKAPVSALELAKRNGNAYDTLASDRFDWTGRGEVEAYTYLPKGMKAVRATYTAGWTSETLPKDLRDALIDLVALKLQAVSNFSSVPTASGGEEGEGEGGQSASTAGQLKKITAGSYTEEYSTAETEAYWKAKASQLSRSLGDNVPRAIKEALAGYRLPVVR